MSPAVLTAPQLNRLLLDAVLAWDGSVRDGQSRAHARSLREPAVASAENADDLDRLATLGGDGGAYARIVARHQQAVAHHLHRFARDAGTREQLVQDTFVEAWSSLAGYRARSPLRHWLLAIATRVGYRHWTSQSRRAGETAIEALTTDELAQLCTAATTSGAGNAASASHTDSADEAHRAAELVHRLLERLPPRDRLVITLLHLQAHSVAETAELTGWSRTMVKVQAFRARAKLRALIERGTR